MSRHFQDQPHHGTRREMKLDAQRAHSETELSSKLTLSAAGRNARNDSDRVLGETFWDKMDKQFEDILSESKLSF